MKKFFSILLSVLLLSVAVTVKAEVYTPVTEETAVELVQTVRSTFYSEEFNDTDWENKVNVLLLDPEIDDAEELASLGLTSIQAYTFVTGVAWPEQYGVGPNYTVPKQVLKDSTIPFYFTFNADTCNTMNDYALEGITINLFEHMFRDKSDYFGSRVDYAGSQTFSFMEKSLDFAVMATKDSLGGTIRMYELSKWSQSMRPPAGENAPWQADLEPEGYRQFYSQTINLYMIVFNQMIPGVTLEHLVSIGFIEPHVYDTYMYLMNN